MRLAAAAECYMTPTPTVGHRLRGLVPIALCIGLILFAGAASAQQGSGQGAPKCPRYLTVEASGDGNHLSWEAGEGTTRIYRSTGEVDGPVQNYREQDGWFQIGETDEGVTEFVDKNVTDGVTYSYLVNAYNGIESFNCEPVSVTAVPFLGGPLGVAAAAAAAMGGFVLFARRRS